MFAGVFSRFNFNFLTTAGTCFLQKIRLACFEREFDEHVQRIDEKYRGQVDNLRSQNAELR